MERHEVVDLGLQSLEQLVSATLHCTNRVTLTVKNNPFLPKQSIFTQTIFTQTIHLYPTAEF
jgi:hypothetical protein